MNKICTSLEQSQKLLELGIDVNTADMFYTIIDQGLYLEVKQGIEPSKDDIPAWSLSALLKMMPITCVLSISNGHYQIVSNETNTFFHNNPLDTAFEMILKLYELKML